MAIRFPTVMPRTTEKAHPYDFSGVSNALSNVRNQMNTNALMEMEREKMEAMEAERLRAGARANQNILLRQQEAEALQAERDRSFKLNQRRVGVTEGSLAFTKRKYDDAIRQQEEKRARALEFLRGTPSAVTPQPQPQPTPTPGVAGGPGPQGPELQPVPETLTGDVRPGPLASPQVAPATEQEIGAPGTLGPGGPLPSDPNKPGPVARSVVPTQPTSGGGFLSRLTPAGRQQVELMLASGADPESLNFAAIWQEDQERRRNEKLGLGPYKDMKEKVGVATSLRKEFAARSKDFLGVRDAYDRIGAATPDAAGDIALVFSFMKMLDPISVVREGEQALVRNAASLMDRAQNTLNKLRTGEDLSPNQRRQFKAQARMIMERVAKRQARLTKQYRTYATRAYLNPDNIVDFDEVRFPDAPNERGAMGTQNLPPTAATTRDERLKQRAGSGANRFSNASDEELSKILGQRQ